MAKLRVVAALTVAAVAGMLALVAPTPANAAGVGVLMKAQRSAKYIDANLYWDWCEDNAHQKEIIYLEKFTSICGDQGGIGNVWGFVSLGYNPNDPDYPFTIEICQLHSGTMWGYFEEAYGTWASTGIVDRFGDDYGGPCKVLTVLFNVRKFYAEWGGDSSYWVLSWPLAP